MLPEEEKIELRKDQLVKLLETHSFSYLKNDIAYTKNKKVKKFWAYFVKSCNSGHYSREEQEKKEIEIKNKKEKEEEIRKEKIQIQISSQNKNYNNLLIN